MGYFYFVRHGESKWNVENKICGCTDIELTEKGVLQAEQTAQLIKDNHIRIDMILSSPLLRARKTAEVISQITGIPMCIEERLIEQNFGIFEGTPRDGKDFYDAKLIFPGRFGNGESMLKTVHRVYGLLDEITAQDDVVYLLAAHNGLARIVESYFREMSNEEFAAFGLKNCELKKYEY